MEEMQKYDCLYNKYSQEFKYRNKEDNAWKEVASRFEDLTPSEATKRFKNIRSSYTRFLKEKRRHNLAQRDSENDSSLRLKVGIILPVVKTHC